MIRKPRKLKRKKEQPSTKPTPPPKKAPKKNAKGAGRTKGKGAATQKMRMFARIYARTVPRDAYKAYRDAGYKGKGDSGLRKAQRLLEDERVQVLIAEELDYIQKRSTISADRILLENDRLALFDIRKCYNRDGTLIPIPDLDDETAAAISGMKVRKVPIGKRKVIEKGKTVTKQVYVDVLEYTSWNKNQALTNSMQNRGLLEPKTEEKSIEEQAKLLRESMQVLFASMPGMPKSSGRPKKEKEEDTEKEQAEEKEE